jgi:hypothetical protein
MSLLTIDDKCWQSLYQNVKKSKFQIQNRTFPIREQPSEKGVDSTPALNITVAHSLLIIMIKKGRGMFGSITAAPKGVLKRAKYHPNLFSG